MARAATAIGILIGGLCLAFAAAAEERGRLDEPFEITADRITYDDARSLYVADGHVRVVQGERRMRARWVAFSTETGLGVAEGDVEVVDGPDVLQAGFMVFDVETLQGTLFQGVLDAGSQEFRIEAAELVRTGENTFMVRDGVFTTCRCLEGERLPWQIRASNADVEVGEYGTVRNATFEILGVPALWVPWAFFPVKSERETGFLLPEFGFGGRGGVGVGVPFFWAALPELNVTAMPWYFSRRGYKQDLELEYVFGRESEGKLFVAGLKDSTQDRDSVFRKARWAAIWEHDHFMPAGLRWQTDLKLSSDNLYADDFRELHDYNAFRFIESTTNVARGFGASGGFGAMVAARYADDLQGSTFDDGDERILARFAEVRGDVLPGVISGPLGIEARMDTELIHFSGLRSAQSEIPGVTSADVLKSDGRFFDVGVDGRVGGTTGLGEGNGVYDEGEPLAERGTRFQIHPRLSRPFRIGGLAELVPEIGWQQTLYQSTGHTFADRGLFTARAELRSRLARSYDFDGGGSLLHLVEPGIGWALVSQQRRQRSNPQFVPRATVEQDRLRTLSLESVTRNPSDRIESANKVVLSMGHRIFTRSGPGSAPRLRADVITALDVDFARSDGLGNFVLDARLLPVGPMQARVRGTFDPESLKFEEGEGDLAFSYALPIPVLRRLTMAGSYRYRRRIPLFAESYRGRTSSRTRTGDTELSQLEVTTSVELAWRMRLTYSKIYSFVKGGGSIRDRGVVEYVSKCRCWGAGFEARYETNQGFQYGITVRFLGLGSTREDNLFSGGLGTGFGF